MGKCVVPFRFVLAYEIVDKIIPQKQTFEKKNLNVLTIKPFYRISPSLLQSQLVKVWLQPAALDKQICGLLRFVLAYEIVGKIIPQKQTS